MGMEVDQATGLRSAEGRGVMNLSVQVLGPVEVACGNGAIGLGGPKPRALLAMLALEAGSTVSTDRLLDGLWGEDPPATAPKLIQVYVSHLRKALTGAGAEGAIATRGHGYELAVDRAQVDATRFERLLAQGAAREALQLWRGSPLSDVSLEPFAAAEIRRLTELRAAALELAIDQDLAAGRHREVLPELESLLGQEPFRERLHAQRILALYRCGRQADALEGYRQARATLINDVGVEPGPELRRLNDAILRQDPSLDSAAPDTNRAPGPEGESIATRQRQTTARLAELAHQTSQERAGLRVIEDEFASGVVELQDLQQRAGMARATREAFGCPFKGLESFEFDDAGIFFGRERLVADLVARLPGSRLVGIVGPSGSGKSSLARAGLLPALAAGVLPGSAQWQCSVIRPGAHPRAALQAAVRELPADLPAVLLVDQCEEAFTACEDEAERAQFFTDITALARDHRRRTLVIIAIRSDFYGHCAAYPEFSRMLDANTVLVGSMRRDELRRAVELPAQRAGLDVEPGLVEALVGDVEGEPGALPMLSTALMELWQHATTWQPDDDPTLRLITYQQTGGVQGAVARLAETAYTALDERQQQRAKRLFLRLAGDGDVRLRVPLADVDADEEVVSLLAAVRLVTVDEGHVEVAHEALLREWPRLVQWLEEDAEGRRLHRHLTAASRDWAGTGRDPGDLYRGSRLAGVAEWVTAHDEDLNDVERDFVAASRAAGEAEAETQRRTNRRLRTLLSGVAGLLVVAIAAGAIAIWQRGQAQGVAVIADARRLGAEALNREQLDEALLLASAGVELHPSTETYSSLLSVLLRQPALLGELHTAAGSQLYSVAVSPDDSMVAVGDTRGEVTVYDIETRTPLSPPHQQAAGAILDLRFSPDSTTLAVSASGESRGVELIDPQTGTLEQRFSLASFSTRTRIATVETVFHPNGRDLIVQETDFDFPKGVASRLTRLDGRTAKPVLTRSIGRSSSTWDLVATADRQRLFLTSPGDNVTYEVDTDSLQIRRTYAASGQVAAVSADGAVLAMASKAGRMRVLDLATGSVRQFAGSLEEPLDLRIVFAPNGRTLVAGNQAEIVVWDVATGRVRERLDAHADAIRDLAISSDSRTLYSVAFDGRLAIWDLAGDRRFYRGFDAGRPFMFDREEPQPRGLAVSPDGHTIAVTQGDGSVHLLDAATLERRTRLRGFAEEALAAAFSPDGERLAATGDRGDIVIWDLASRAVVRTIEATPLASFSQSLVFTPDGRRLVSGEQPASRVYPGRVRVYDAETGEAEEMQFPIATPSLSLSPDGRYLAAAGIEVPTEVRDLKTGEVVARLETGDSAQSVAFSPDGRFLAVGHYGGSTVLLSTEDFEPVGNLSGQRARVTSLAFSPDGTRLVAATARGTVQLWDVVSQSVLGAPLTVEPDAVIAATFTPDGTHVVAVPQEGDGLVWDVRPGAWKRHACAVAGRTMSEEDWRQQLPGRPYREVCGAL